MSAPTKLADKYVVPDSVAVRFSNANHVPPGVRLAFLRLEDVAGNDVADAIYELIEAALRGEKSGEETPRSGV